MRVSARRTPTDGDTAGLIGGQLTDAAAAEFEPSCGMQAQPSGSTRPSKPLRVADLDVHEVEDGYVVYDEPNDRVHYVNATAVLVLELCNGERTSGQIAELVKKAFGLDNAPLAEVDDCLTTLETERLVV